MPKINWTGFRMALLVLAILIILILACPRKVSGQQVISAKAGLLHYFEGDVYIEERNAGGDLEKTKIPQSKTRFVQLEEEQVFSTEDGRAEILLAPGMFLRMSENCAIRFSSTRLDIPIVVVLPAVPLNEKRCIIVFDFLDMPRDLDFWFKYYNDDPRVANWLFNIQKRGVYHFSTGSLSTSAVLRVLSGEVNTDEMEGFSGRLSKGKSLILREPKVVVKKLEKNFSDEALRWSKKRDSYLAAANVWAAKNIFDGFTRNNWRNNFWYWNPYFGMYTFIPGRGNIDCYWGFRFFNPRGAANYYNWASSQNAYSGGFGNQPQSVQPAPTYGYRSDLGYTVGPRGSWSEGSSSSSGVIPSRQSPRTSESAIPREGAKSRGR